MRTAKNEPKKVVVMLSTTFPVGHKREKQPTGFRESLLAGKKIHTIREDAKGLWQKRCKEINEGKKYISIREWTGRPYNSEQRIIKEVHQVSLQKITIVRTAEHKEPRCWVDGKQVPIDQVAANDGLDNDDFISFMFFGLKGIIFDGVIIQLTDFRY